MRRREWRDRAPRESLDPALPEDIAFRPASEGGDRTILPARRRPPPGPRTTQRVIVPDARYIVPEGEARSSDRGTQPDPFREWLSEEIATGSPDDRDDRDEVDAVDDGVDDLDRADVDDDDRADRDDDRADRDDDRDDRGEEDEDDGDNDDEEPRRPRRRRGRRGGRGRRRSRPAESLDDDDSDADDSDADDSDADDADADEDRDDADDRRIRDADASGAAPAHDDDDDAVADADDDVADDDEADDDRGGSRVVAATRRADSVAAADAPQAFAELGISDAALAWLTEVGFSEPTPVQREAIPVLLSGRDVVGVAQTGTGKTLAFGIPMAEALDPSRARVQAIVLVPTRELAQQVESVLRDLGRFFDLQTIGLLGGRRLDDDFRALDSGPQVVVGTPGRVLDHLRRGTLSLRDVRYAVLDEADQMLDIGFMPDITRILSRTPRSRQTALFSATMPTSVKNIIWRFMDDPKTVEIEAEYRTVDTIEQVYFEVAQRDKVAGLRELVERELRGRSLIFCNTKRAVDNLTERLQGRGVTVGALHGDMDQRRRDRVVKRFRDGDVDVLIATNVAARGLDIPEVTHVVNYDVPQNAEEYVHRIGRTGRAGREGRAITFVSEHDMQPFEVVLAEFGDQMRAERLDLYAPSGG